MRGALCITAFFIGAFGCVPLNAAFYVQDSMQLKTVTITECSDVVFRDVDSGMKAKRQTCAKRTLNASQRRAWEKFRPELNEVTRSINFEEGDGY